MENAISFLFLAICLASDPPATAITQHVDLIEINHYYDDAGKSVFDQLIYYNWDQHANRFNVCAWRLIKNPNQLPVRQPASGKYMSTWHDDKLLLVVYADRTMESWTQYDPETMERTFFPKENRPDLIKYEFKK